MNCRSILMIVLSLFLITGCIDLGPGEKPGPDPDQIYFDYKIAAVEENEDITLLIQFRNESPFGKTILLEPPAGITLDGEPIPPDSSRMTGPYYETSRPKSGFSGDHTLIFTNTDGRTYEEVFSFRPFRLVSRIPAIVRRNDLQVELEGLDTLAFVRVLLTDTSFANPGINRLDTIRNGRVIISKADLERLSNGPIFLELIREIERPVTAGTSAGGQISISYALRREFSLEN